jgi:hypothetical protein
MPGPSRCLLTLSAAIAMAVPELAGVKLTICTDPALNEELVAVEKPFAEAKHKVIFRCFATFTVCVLQPVDVFLPLVHWSQFGVLYCRTGQTDEDSWYSNSSSPEFEEFLQYLGEKVKLQGFTRYRGGLDVKCTHYGQFFFFFF